MELRQSVPGLVLKALQHLHALHTSHQVKSNTGEKHLADLPCICLDQRWAHCRWAGSFG